MTALTYIGGFTVVCWAAASLLIARLWWLGREQERKAASRHADVDLLARQAKAFSARSARVERWHDLPTVDELGI
jgi:hypothetical protein